MWIFSKTTILQWFKKNKSWNKNYVKKCTAKNLINSINYINFIFLFTPYWLVSYEWPNLFILHSFFSFLFYFFLLFFFFLFLVCFLAPFFRNASFIHVVHHSFSPRLKIHIKSINFTACFYGLKDNNITLFFLHSFRLNDCTEGLKNYGTPLWKIDCTTGNQTRKIKNKPVFNRMKWTGRWFTCNQQDEVNRSVVY